MRNDDYNRKWHRTDADLDDLRHQASLERWAELHGYPVTKTARAQLGVKRPESVQCKCCGTEYFACRCHPFCPTCEK